MERNERLKAAYKCALKYTNENEARIAKAAFMLGCEFEAQGEIVKGVVLETEEEHWKPSEEQMKALEQAIVRSYPYGAPLSELYEQLFYHFLKDED